jgi:hypothetical protein
MIIKRYNTNTMRRECVTEIIDDVIRIVVAVAENDPPITWSTVRDVNEFELKDFRDMPHALYLFKRKIDASHPDKAVDMQGAFTRMSWAMEIRRLYEMTPIESSIEFSRLCKLCK